jgi:hypothetical protein
VVRENPCPMVAVVGVRSRRGIVGSRMSCCNTLSSQAHTDHGNDSLIYVS